MNPVKLLIPPYTLDTFVPLGGGSLVFDALVGGGGEAAWYSIALSGMTGTIQSTHAASVIGDAIAVSPAIAFEQKPTFEAVVATNAAKLYDFDFSAQTPTLLNTNKQPVDVSAYGTPVSVDFGDNGDVWLITTGGWFVAYASPGLGEITSLKTQMTFAGPPVAIAGAKSESIGSVVGATARDPSHSPQLNIFHGGNGNDAQRGTFPLPGDPVAMRATDNGSVQYAWVVTRSPDELVVVDVSNTTQVNAMSLPGEPLGLYIGLGVGAALPASGCTCSSPKTSTGFVHVLVAEP